MLFGIPPGGAHGQIDDIEVQVSFGPVRDDITLVKPNGMFAYQNAIAQPLDQETEVLKIHAENEFIEDGWCHVEIPIAFDPCVCKHPTSLRIEVFKVSQATATITGLIYGLSTPIDIYGSDDYYEDALLNVLKNDINPYVGQSTYKRVDKYLADLAAAEALAANSAAPLPDLLKDINTQLKNISSVAGAVPGLTKWGKGLKVASSILNFVTGVVPQDDKKTKTYPSVIDAEVAMSGIIEHETKVDRAEFVIETPGVADNTNTTEFGTDVTPAYPFYNEALGRFALLNTPKMKRQNGVDFSPPIRLSDGTTLVTRISDITYQLDETIIDYVYNPAIGVNKEKTKIFASYVVEIEEGSLTGQGFVDGLELAYVNPNQNNKHVYKSPFLPLECLAQTTVTAAWQRVDEIRNSNGTPVNTSVQLRDITNVYLQLMIFYEFNELDREGLPNKDVQILTYPIGFDDNHGTNLIDDLSTIASNK